MPSLRALVCFSALLLAVLSATEAKDASAWLSDKLDQSMELGSSPVTASPTSWFQKGEGLATLKLDSATTCSGRFGNIIIGGFSGYDDFNYLTCARDEKPDSSNFDPLGVLGSRVGYCTVTTLASWPLDESYDHFLGQFTFSCHISSDDTCHDSLGCADLEISAVGRYMETYTNFAVTVDPVAAYPPYGPGCGEREIIICPGPLCPRSGPTSKEARQMRHNMTRGARTAPKVGAKPQAATQHYYGGEEPLPEMVWVYDERFLAPFTPSALVYGGQMSVLDRHTKQEVATGWMELVQLSLFLDRDGRPDPGAWTQVSTSSLPTDTLFVRHPWRYTFTFSKEEAPYSS